MKHTRWLICLVLLLLPAAIAFAWPNQPPDRAFITGPGLNGEVEITDALTLEALRLGVTEDFEHGPLDAPVIQGEGYRITRYFEGGEFNFATLHYYPNSGEPGYLLFEDGDDLIGNHTAYNNQWYYATPLGDAALQNLLNNLGVEIDEPTNQSKNAAAPSVIINRLSGWLSALWGRATFANS